MSCRRLPRKIPLSSHFVRLPRPTWLLWVPPEGTTCFQNWSQGLTSSGISMAPSLQICTSLLTHFTLHLLSSQHMRVVTNLERAEAGKGDRDPSGVTESLRHTESTWKRTRCWKLGEGEGPDWEKRIAEVSTRVSIRATLILTEPGLNLIASQQGNHAQPAISNISIHLMQLETVPHHSANWGLTLISQDEWMMESFPAN